MVQGTGHRSGDRLGRLKMIGKKAQAATSDTAIFTGICMIFVVFGAVLPFIQHDFSSPELTLNNGSLIPSVNPAQDNDPITATFSWFGVFFSIVKMFVWTFGALPVWADLVVEIFRIILYFIGFRMIRGI